MLPIFLLIILGHAVQTQDLQWYKSEMVHNVVPPYILAYSALQIGIIDPLLAVTNTSIIDQLANKLNCGAIEFNNNLSQALMNSDAIRRTIDETIIQLIQAIGDWENKIKQSLNDIEKVRVEIQSKEKEVKIAEEGLKEKQSGLDAANKIVQDAEKAMEDARNCQRRKRRRRFIGNIFTNGFLKPICSLFNHNGFKNAFERQIEADKQYQNAKDQFDTYQDSLNDLKSQEQDLNTQIIEGTTQMNNFNSTLFQFKQQHLIVIDINEQIKKMIIHLTSIFDSSSILREVINKLLDFELLIIPLNIIYKNMLDNELVSNAAGIPSISSETITKIRNNLNQIAIKLPNIPFNMNGTSFLLKE